MNALQRVISNKKLPKAQGIKCQNIAKSAKYEFQAPRQNYEKFQQNYMDPHLKVAMRTKATSCQLLSALPDINTRNNGSYRLRLQDDRGEDDVTYPFMMYSAFSRMYESFVLDSSERRSNGTMSWCVKVLSSVGPER